MMCKFCGMDSATTDVCSWCGKPLNALAAVVAPVPATQPVAPVPPAPEESFAPEVDAAQDTANATPFAGRSLSAPPLSTPPASAPGAGSPGAGAAGGRKFAPAMPPPQSGKLRAPAPAAPLPPGRSAAPAPSLNADVPAAASPRLSLNEMANAASLTGETPAGRAPDAPASAAPSLTQAEPLNAPFLLTQASAPVPSVPSLSGAALPDVSTRPLQSKAQSDAIPESAIGTGVSPQRVLTDAPAPAAATAPDAKQRKAAVDAALADSGPAPMQLLSHYLGVFGVIALVTGLLAFIGKPFYVAPMLIAMFASAMLLPILRVTDWADEDTDDVIWFVLLTLLFGPLVALIIYGVVAVARQDFNPAVLGCLAVAAVLRVVGEVASSGIGVLGHLIQATSPFTSFGNIGQGLVKKLLLNWSGFVALAGWFAASPFHKEDE